MVAKKHSLSLEKGLDQHVGYSDEQPRTMHGSFSSLESESSDPELYMFILEAGNLPEDK